MPEITAKSNRFPGLPASISGLEKIACNLNWSWNRRARGLFALLDPEFWVATEYNPVRMLNDIDRGVLRRAAADPEFVREYKLTLRALFPSGKQPRSWFAREFPQWSEKTIAYFSAEFGLHSSLPIYSGGLGILSGDHCKQADDLGIPLVGIGFVYPQGYFHQRIRPDGWQEDGYELLDRRNAPMESAGSGPRLLVEIAVGPARIFVEVWRVNVGSNSLYLMDSGVEENSTEDRALTFRLYGGDRELRIRQEIVLGIGGVRVLESLGIAPGAFHGNEGHTAFMLLDRVRGLVRRGVSFDDAARQVRASSVFTTHTPLAAGNDAFDFPLVEEHFAGYWDELGISRQQFLDLGSYDGQFNMTVLGFNLAERRNGVSALHGRVTRRMWQALWPKTPEDQIPITSITNGVHAPTWIAAELGTLFANHLGLEWTEHYDEVAFWNRVADIPDEEFWRVHQILKKKLLSFARERARTQWAAGAVDATQAIAMGTLLDPDALTIGFARRFTGYKRAALIFQDLDRLQKLILNPLRPVQIVFAGKAHPADEDGKAIIHRIYNYAASRDMAGHVSFIENYEMHAAGFLTQGVDVWLNNPRAPLEACGTSGQKAGMNGVLNLSILDGWWNEGYNGDNGFAIGDPPQDLEPHDNDERDAVALYELLEEQVVPLFYDRGYDGLPHGWIAMAKESLRTIVPQYSASRMLKEYMRKMYAPALSSNVTP